MSNDKTALIIFFRELINYFFYFFYYFCRSIYIICCITSLQATKSLCKSLSRVYQESIMMYSERFIKVYIYPQPFFVFSKLLSLKKKIHYRFTELSPKWHFL